MGGNKEDLRPGVTQCPAVEYSTVYSSTVSLRMIPPKFEYFFLYLLGENEEVMIVDEPAPSRKRKAEETQPEVEEQLEKSAKRAKVKNSPEGGGDDGVIVL